MKKVIFIVSFIFVSVFVLADRYSSLETFAQVLNVIKIHYFQDVKIETLVQGAIKGLLREIDPHSQFFTHNNFEKIKDHTEGKFHGVGITVDKRDGFLIISTVLKGSSASKVGLKQGDKILTVNNVLVKDLNIGEFSEIFTKKSGYYKIIVLRNQNKKPLEFKVRPTHVKIASTNFKPLGEGYFYLKIVYFSQSTLYDINKHLKDKNIKALLLDLRNNPGGSLTEAVKIADLFLDKGVIVSYKTRHRAEDKVFKAHLAGTLKPFPLVVLINEYSASASEVLAGALKDHKRAKLIGRKTFGKGSIQTFFPIQNKYGLKLTIGEYKTPSKASIHNKGIKPHVVISKADTNKNQNFKNLLDDKEVLLAFKQLQKL